LDKALETFQPRRELGNSNILLLLAAYVLEQRCNANKKVLAILYWCTYFIDGTIFSRTRLLKHSNHV